MDWIEGFLAYTERVSSPDIFRLWAGITTIAGALERRVWLKTVVRPVFPNIYALLVAAPGVGKTEVITRIRDMWDSTAAQGDNKRIHVAPKSVTKASLLDCTSAAAKRLAINNGAGIVEYSSLAIASGEFGNVVPAHDSEFLNVLNDIYDNPRDYKENRRVSKSVDITQPQITMIGGTTPSYLSELLPDSAWAGGFMSRTIMIHSGASPKLLNLFDFTESEAKYDAELKREVLVMTEMYGEVQISNSAAVEIMRWYHEGLVPEPQHSKLTHYCTRRLVMFLKLVIIASVSRSRDLRVTHEDVNRARDWLLGAEQAMPDIFKAMTGKSDEQIMQELHFFMWADWAKNKKPIHSAAMWKFLGAWTISERIEKVIETTVRSGMIRHIAGTNTYIPRPKNEHGTE